MKINPIRVLLATTLLAGSAIGAAAYANPILEDFTSLEVQSYTDNFVSKGVSYSVNCHHHLSTETYPGSTSTGQWLGFDPSGCVNRYDEKDFVRLYNDRYLGPDDIGLEAKLFVSLANHRTFDLLSFDFIYGDGGATRMDIHSSKGGELSLDHSWNGPSDPRGLILEGEEWKGVDWIMFSQEYSSSFSGIDNLLLNRTNGRVPEPGTSTVWVAMLGAALIARRRRSSR